MVIMFKSPLFTQDIFQEMVQTAENNCYIDPQLHERFNTKRGLRNSDGRGSGWPYGDRGCPFYIVDEHEKIPVEGRLAIAELKSMTW